MKRTGGRVNATASHSCSSTHPGAGESRGRRQATFPAAVLCLALLALGARPGLGKERAKWFTNVAAEVGLAGVRAKDAILVDLDGDGFHDLCLDRERFYLSRRGRKFELLPDPGIEFPEVKIVPLGKDGKPNRAKARKMTYLPQYLYFADLDNDGDQDAVFGVHSTWEWFDRRRGKWITVKECDPGVRSSVWLNDGKGRFHRAKPSGFTAPEAAGPAMALAVVDYDGDGNLDLFEGREYRRYGVLYGCGVDRLYRGDGRGGFTDVTEKAGLLTTPMFGGPRSSRPTYGVTAADWNNDGWPDLLQLSYGRQWNYLWRNDGDGTFTDVGPATGFAGDEITHGRYPAWVRRPPEPPFRANGNTFDCAVGDYDNDGDLDLFLGEIQHAWAGESSDPPSLLENLGAEGGWKFRRHPVTEFLPPRPSRDPKNRNYGDLHVAWLDVDNDTRLDLLIGSGDYPDGQFLRLYRQKADGTFEDLTDLAGFDWEGCGDLSLGDFDRDGDVDILAGRSFMRLSKAHRDKYMGGLSVNEVGLFRNDIGNRSGNHWLNVRLAGRSANRSGIGARITVTAGGVTQIREIRAGSGLANHEDPPEACFGLGKAKRVDRLVVRWPDREHSEQVFRDLPADRFLVIEQGRKKIRMEKASAR